MSVLVKGMEMPEKCPDCQCSLDLFTCKFTGKQSVARPKSCPLIELPEEHEGGRMSVLVKGMRMPNNCMACDLEELDDCGNGYRCPLIYKGYTAKIRNDGKLPKCPLVELPKGEWLRMSDLSEKDDNRYKCSRCGNVIHHKSRMALYTFNSWCGRCGSNNSRHTTIIEGDKWEEDAPTVIEAEGVEE